MPAAPAQLRSLSLTDLVRAARGAGVENPAGLSRQELVAAVLREQQATEGEGVLEILPDGFGFLRAPEFGYAPGADDIYVSPSQIRRFNLRTGDTVRGQVRAPKENERYFALIKVEQVNGESPDAARDKVLFDNLVPARPHRPMEGLPVALLHGSRVFLVGPARSGRTARLVALAQAIAAGHPGVALFTVLVAERPEDVPDLAKALPGEVAATTFDEQDTRHVQVAEMVVERARRRVEARQDAVVLLDSLTRLGRAANALAPAGGRAVNGLDVGALQRIKRLIAAARDTREGGSLTLVAVLDEGDPVERELAGYENARM